MMMINADDVKYAVESLSDKFENNIEWYETHSNSARMWHYITFFALVIVATAVPVLSAILAVWPEPVPLELRLVTVSVTGVTAGFVWIREFGNFQEQWRTYYMSRLALQSMRRKYKAEKARLKGEANLEAKYDLVEETATKLENYLKSESARTFRGLRQSLQRVVNEMKAAHKPSGE